MVTKSCDLVTRSCTSSTLKIPNLICTTYFATILNLNYVTIATKKIRTHIPWHFSIKGNPVGMVDVRLPW